MSGGGDATIGPFRLGRILGAGGMGVVREARHVETGERVAIKTVRVADPALLHGMRREIHALAALRHPGIVRIVAHGVDGGLPWYAMTFLDGPTLRDALAPSGPPVATVTDDGIPTLPIEAGTTGRTAVLGRNDAPGREAGAARLSPLPGGTPRALTVTRRLCDALAYMHGEGIVHRDLKPENVLLLGDDQPVVVDLGLAGRFAAVASRETLEGSGEAAGTASYMAPEQIRGEPVDARADLYAVGCILYELLTGRPPFLTRSIPELLGLHESTPPDPPSRWADGIPRDLDELTLGLLVKDPRRRIGHASAVARLLVPLGAAGDPGAPTPRPYLYRPRLAGRSAEMDVLAAVLSDAARGRGGVVGIGGESGAGKTRLALELSSRARHRGFRVVTGECGTLADGRSTAAPLAPLGRLLLSVADRCRELGTDAEKKLPGAARSILARFEPSLAALDGRRTAPPWDLPLEEDRLRVREALLVALDALADERPALVIVDDVQWADDDTLGFLAWACRGRRLERLPVAIAVAYREEETGPALASLVASPGFARVPLRRLAPGDVASVVSDMLGLEAPDERLSLAILGHSEGNPLFVAEYLRAALGDGLLSQGEDGRWTVTAPAAAYEGLMLPRSLSDLLSRRFETVSRAARQILDAAAVLGRPAAPALLGAVTGASEEALVAPLAELLARHVLEDAADGTLAFPHGKIREAAYAGATPERLRLLHGRAAAALSAEPGRTGALELEEIAAHWERGGEIPKAREAYLAAARAAPAHAHALARRAYRAHLALADRSRPETLRARLEMLDLVRGAQPEDYRAESEHAMEDARSLGDDGLVGRACRHLSRSLRRDGSMTEARGLLEEAVSRHRRAAEVVEVGLTLGELASCAEDSGRVHEAGDLYREAISTLGQASSPETAVLLINYGGYLRGAGRLQEARAAFQQALERARAAGAMLDEANALGNLGNVATDRGLLHEAQTLYEASLALFRRVGDRRGEAISLMNQGKVALESGRLLDALRLLEGALTMLEEAGDRRLQVHALTALAEIHARGGRSREALRANEQALHIAREIGDQRRLATALYRRGRLLVEDGVTEEGARDLHASLSMLREQGSVGQVADVLLMLSSLDLAAGRLEAAEDLLREAAEAFDASGQVPSRAAALVELAACARLRGDPGAAATRLLEADALLARGPGVSELVLAACEAGHQALARGIDAGAHLARAAALVAGKQLGEDAEPVRALDKLRVSAAAAASGERLLRGQTAGSFPGPLRERLLEEATKGPDGYTPARGAPP